ncbi:hypothetical protein M2322_003552 [Rhodoblastus acidophilus]|uniref:hypothetical protein n=1 Tax=Rhodoblastus acidophilus TaxID=1074 RepID=UPI00222489AF|nr:hypothetical protein [Rhodoblastus acidophilus]MCW2317987.1 hypothetical protein [Rhodoblastus acidophilus]
MRIFDRLFAALLVLGVLGAAPVCADTSIVMVSGWTQIGAGTVIVNALSNEGVWLLDAPATPTAETGAILVPFGAISPALTAKGNWYAKPGMGAGATKIGVATGGNPSTIYSVRVTAATTAAALPAQSLVNGIICKAPSTNTATIFIGPAGVTAATGYPLMPGEAISYGATNATAINFVGSNASDVLSCTGN